ncbi:MAG TPA: biotin/lipoyl-containing protein, partial [Actinomycetota bacterium]|nr:biotin/lipoyl-containing protein [Actinomycetota bacterium]
MAIPVKMPQLGESVTEGTVGRWLKQPGDQVDKYEPLLEVVSDKVDTEVTATDAGTLVSIEVQEGETVAVGTVLAYIGAAGEQPAATAGAGAAVEAVVQDVQAAAAGEAEERPSEPAPSHEPAPGPVQGAGKLEAQPDGPAPAPEAAPQEPPAAEQVASPESPG